MRKYKLMTDKEKKYLKALIRDYNLTINTCRVKSFQHQETYEQLYKRMDYEEKLVLELQSILIDIKPCDIQDFWKDKKKSLVSTHSFIRTLYSQRTDESISGKLIKTCEKLMKWLKDSNIVNS